MGGAHSRVRGCDNGHSVSSITGIQLRDELERVCTTDISLSTLGFHTRTCRGPSSICLRSTGCGHALVYVREDSDTTRYGPHH